MTTENISMRVPTDARVQENRQDHPKQRKPWNNNVRPQHERAAVSRRIASSKRKTSITVQLNDCERPRWLFYDLYTHVTSATLRGSSMTCISHTNFSAQTCFAMSANTNSYQSHSSERGANGCAESWHLARKSQNAAWRMPLNEALRGANCNDDFCTSNLERVSRVHKTYRGSQPGQARAICIVNSRNATLFATRSSGLGIHKE